MLLKMRTKLLSILMIGILGSCYANVPINEIPKDNKIDVKIDNKQDVKPSVSNAPIVIVNTPIPTPIVTKAPVEENDNTKLTQNNIVTPQGSPIPSVTATIYPNTQPLPEPSNYGISCTPADFSSLPLNNLNDVYNPEDPKHKINIKTFLELRGEIIIFLGFKNLYKIRQLSLLTKKEEDKFTFVSQSCFDTTKLNNIIKNSSTRIIYDSLNDRTVDDIISSESNLTLGEEVLSRLSEYSLVFKAEPTEEGYKKSNDFILKLREIEAFKYIETNGLGTTS
jgi:hypothetical protein